MPTTRRGAKRAASEEPELENTPAKTPAKNPAKRRVRRRTFLSRAGPTSSVWSFLLAPPDA